MKEKNPPLVGIIMGSDSDWPTMEAAYKVCREFNIASEVRVVSAHRTPDDMARYAKTAHQRGLQPVQCPRRGKMAIGELNGLRNSDFCLRTLLGSPTADGEVLAHGHLLDSPAGGEPVRFAR